MSSAVVFSPAKINLFLAVTSRRADGYHDLVSVVAPVEFGDTLRIEAGPAGEFGLECDDAAVPAGEENLVLRAAWLFAEKTGWGGGAKFFLEKRVPMGAGLGGGSSNAVAALRGLNSLAGELLGSAELAAMAARVGSDCALFLPGGPVVMRGRGERVEPLSTETAARLRGLRVLIFKPGFSIGTSWAYGQLAADGEKNYLAAAEAEARLAAWLGDAELAAVAARLGSDCTLFLPGGPVVMRGRGERVEPLSAETAVRLRGQRVLIFKPGFSIGTPWAYAQLAASGEKNYLPAAEAEARLAAWLGDAKAPVESLLFNSFERPAFRKFPALPVLLDALGAEFGLATRLSGSGSACFALLPAGAAVEAVKSRIREAWGATAWVVETRIS